MLEGDAVQQIVKLLNQTPPDQTVMAFMPERSSDAERTTSFNLSISITSRYDDFPRYERGNVLFFTLYLYILQAQKNGLEYGGSKPFQRLKT